MKILTAAQMRETDRLTSERCGIPSDQLMENAGAAIADYMASAYPDLATYNMLVLCGKGNNGGDGLVVARRLRERGLSLRVILFAEPTAMRGDAAANLKRWQQGNAELRVVTSKAEWDVARGVLAEADLIVDALLGTGLTGPVEGLLAQVIEDVNAVSDHGAGKANAKASRRVRVVSVDMPSGLASDAVDLGGPVIAADVTVTLTAPKLGQMVSPRADRVGQLIVREIGTPPELLDDDSHLKLHWLEPGEFRGLPLVRRRDSNKGTFGHALVVAGSLGKSGAAVLAGRAALRVGAGLATVATPTDVLPVVAAGMPELMTAPLLATEAGSASVANFDYGRFAAILHGKSVLAIGPGLSTDDQAQQFIRAAVLGADQPVILDADGLNAFAGQAELLNTRKAAMLAITPHPGEMARLLGLTVPDVQARRLDVALETAARWNACVILKGFHTILALPDGRAFVNTTGNPGMATGGTGDVLTGMLAGLTAEFGVEHWERVLGLGIYLHGLAGDLAAARVGEIPLVASDLIEALPAAFAQLLAECGYAGH
jgi:ADP-dependent NAD(P)H-hydrate dehydratase / NAD(P)H-hydrate epimerase